MIGSRLLWASTIGFLLGVLLRSFVPLGLSYVLCLVLLAGVVLMTSAFNAVHGKSSIVVACAFLFCALGIWRMGSAIITKDPILTQSLSSRVTLLGTVSSEPDVRDSSVHIPVDVRALMVGSSTNAVHARVLVFAPLHTPVSYGDEVTVSGTLKTPQPFDTGLGRQFYYPQYLGSQGVSYTISFARVTTAGVNTGNVVQSSAIAVKQTFLDGLHHVLPEPEAGLAGGITVGDKRSIGPALTADFQKVSLTQILVLSGYNITVVANFFAHVLSWAPSVVRFGSGIFVVVFFMLISGGASSAVRAGLMALLAMYARTSLRAYDALRALAVVVVAMVLWNPWVLAFDPGFQLSALAMVGLVLGTPVVSQYLLWVTERGGLRELVASSVSTQLAVLPLILYQDGQFSLLSLPANILAMIPIPVAMFASCLASLGGILAGTYATPLAYPAYLLLAYIISVGQFFASFTFASLSIGVFSVWWMFISYAVLINVCVYAQKKSGEGKNPTAAL